MSELEQLKAELSKRVEEADSLQAIEALRVEALGKKGLITQQMKSLRPPSNIHEFRMISMRVQLSSPTPFQAVGSRLCSGACLYMGKKLGCTRQSCFNPFIQFHNDIADHAHADDGYPGLPIDRGGMKQEIHTRGIGKQ